MVWDRNAIRTSPGTDALRIGHMHINDLAKIGEAFVSRHPADEDEQQRTELLREVLDLLLSRLPPEEKDVVELIAVAGCSFQGAADYVGHGDRKRCWRTYKRALARLQDLAEEIPFAITIMEGYAK